MEEALDKLHLRRCGGSGAKFQLPTRYKKRPMLFLQYNVVVFNSETYFAPETDPPIVAGALDRAGLAAIVVSGCVEEVVGLSAALLVTLPVKTAS
jgi:hypothetical protein